LAASFAPPLLRILRQRGCVVYLWGDSGTGKTAALKAAQSIWGDPQRLIINFNATAAGLEYRAAFCSDLPFCLDEKQLASSQKDVDKAIYMLANGMSRTRATTHGSMQDVHTWRIVVIATGEEPISGDTSQTGVSTRALEINGMPFACGDDALQVHQLTSQHYGWAGGEYIRRLIATDEHSICRAYDQIKDEVSNLCGAMSGAHINSVCVLALADALASDWIFAPAESPAADASGELVLSDQARTRAIEMAVAIAQEQIASAPDDINERAARFVSDWLYANWEHFADKPQGAGLGMYDMADDKVMIVPSALAKALQSNGYSPRKTLQHLASQGIIAKSVSSNGKTEYSTRKWWGKKTCRFVELDLARLSKYIDRDDNSAVRQGDELVDIDPSPALPDLMPDEKVSLLDLPLPFNAYEDEDDNNNEDGYDYDELPF
jgi:hypothetical protein